MSFLTALGVDSSIIYLFFIYLIGFLTLYFLIYRPYYAAFLIRKVRTTGGEEKANELSQNIGHLQQDLSLKIRQQREKVQKIFETNLKHAQQQSAQLLSEVRGKIEGQKKDYLEKVLVELAKQKRGVATEVVHLAKLVQDKMEIGT